MNCKKTQYKKTKRPVPRRARLNRAGVENAATDICFHGSRGTVRRRLRETKKRREKILKSVDWYDMILGLLPPSDTSLQPE